MLNDIQPPRRPKTSPPSLSPMRSKRLRGHTAQMARSRLSGIKAQAGAKGKQLSTAAFANKRRPHFFWKMSKKHRIIAVSGTTLAFALIISLFFVFFPHKEPPLVEAPAKVQAEPPPKPKTTASPLTGIQVAPELAARPVTAVMIENSIDARPQSGLQDAGVVFEAIAEGGITRFMALFQEGQPQHIGPVRSLRPYYIDFAAPFQASIAHIGGSPEALNQVRGGGFRDIDQFFNAGAYWRNSGRAAPHNVYTSFEKLDALNQGKGYSTSQFLPWTRKADQPAAPASVTKIDIRISSPLYNVHYDYESASNSYLRSEGGRPHIVTASASDAAGQQLKPKVVIALVVPHNYSGKYSVYGIAGSGPAFVFQDGGLIQGTWTKADRGSQFAFKDAAGNPLALNSGQSWVSLVSSPGAVTYAL